MMDLGGRSVLSHVLGRCLSIKNADVVCCAIPHGDDCNQIAEEAIRCGAVVSRGSETDVLERYHQAAILVNAGRVLRVTSDCPLIDPRVCESVIDLLNDGNCNFATNNAPPSWPHGLDCEAFSAALLAQAAAEASEPFEREHVSPWMRNANPDVHIGNIAAPQDGLSKHRWTLDTPADFTFFCRLFERMAQGDDKGSDTFDYKVPLAIVEADPVLAAINTVSEA